MDEKYDNIEFDDLSKDILEHEEFMKTKDIAHHGISRYNHLLRVGYYTYKVTKFLRLNYREATRAGLLHDFFLEEVKHEKSIARLRKHPEHALKNAEKHFSVDALGKDIIKTHMFPVTFTPPRYLESWIVTIIDDIAGIYERCYSIRNELRTAFTFSIAFAVIFLRIP